MASILDGKTIRDQILAECLPRVESIKAAHGRAPGLAVVLVGEDPGSQIYVRNKVKACADLGMVSEKITPPAGSSTEDILAVIDELNARPDIDGILVQLPMPKQIDAQKVLLRLAPEKDVDGLHPLSLGNLLTNRPGPRPCTPSGVMELLRRNKIAISGKKAVVVGRSDLVGKPMAALLMHDNATVTICHSRTADLPGECASADILVAALGKPAFMTADFIKPGATVVDVGINRINDRDTIARIFRGSEAKLAEFDKKGSLIVGDVHPLDALERAGAYTPVPGGVGLLTIAMLMVNTIDAAQRRLA